VKLLAERKSAFILLVFLLPLLFLNVKDSHDWGDDFAQYFIQSRNILEGRPQTDNGLVFDLQTGEYALKAYPVGLPMILSAAWYFFGDAVIVSSILISLFLVGFGLISFFYFRKNFVAIISLLTALMIVYNPFTTGFKKEVLSDIPFSFLLLSGVLMFQSKKKSLFHFVMTGLIWGFAISMRGIGVALFIALAFLFLQKSVRFFLKKDDVSVLRLLLQKSFVITITACGFYFLLNAFLFPVPTGSIIGFYADALKGENYGRWMFLNLNYYYEVFLNFFATMGQGFAWISTLTKFVMVILFIPGILIAFYRKPGFDDWLFLVYMNLILVYPYLGGGFRFLLPVLPFILKYIFIAADWIRSLFSIKSQVPLIALLVVILLQYIPGNIDHARSMSLTEQGPNEMPAARTFNFIRDLPGDAVVVFVKPRALSFYSGRKAAYFIRDIQPEQLPGLFKRMNAHYFLLCNENKKVDDALLRSFIADNNSKLKIIWRDNYFELYTDL